MLFYWYFGIVVFEQILNYKGSSFPFLSEVDNSNLSVTKTSDSLTQTLEMGKVQAKKSPRFNTSGLMQHQQLGSN